jgi:hypothetical protein
MINKKSLKISKGPIPVKDILGPNIILLDSRFICKYPVSEVQTENDEKAYVAWHQDMR